MKTALFIDADHQFDQTVMLASLSELILLDRAIDGMATGDLNQDDQRRVRALKRRLTVAIDDAKDAAETDHVCLDRVR